MAKKSKIGTLFSRLSRLIYVAVGVAVGAFIASYVARPNPDEVLANGLAVYVAHRSADAPATLSASDCKLRTERVPTDSDNAARIVSCTWDSETTTHVYEISYNAKGMLISTTINDTDKVSN